MFIPPGPNLIYQLNRKQKGILADWFPATQRFFVSKGRVALALALSILEVPPGATLLMPSYMCTTVLSPALSHGCKVAFYAVKRDLTVDLDNFESTIERSQPALVVLIHYFGFPDPHLETLLEISASKDVPVIEDCAHALFSRRGEKPLGLLGQASIFSLVKSLPLPEGGILLLHDKTKNLKERVNLTTMGFAWEIINFFKLLIYSVEVEVGFSLRPLMLSIPGLKSKIYEIDDNSPDSRIRTMGSLSRWLFRYTDPVWIIKRRRANFEYLLEHFNIDPSLAKPLYTELPKGVCPLGFPVISKVRDKVATQLYRQGIGIRTIWDVLPNEIPLNKFPDSRYLRDHILVLPVHQDISFDQIDLVLERLRKVLRKYENVPS